MTFLPWTVSHFTNIWVRHGDVKNKDAFIQNKHDLPKSWHLTTDLALQPIWFMSEAQQAISIAWIINIEIYKVLRFTFCVEKELQGHITNHIKTIISWFAYKFEFSTWFWTLRTFPYENEFFFSIVCVYVWFYCVLSQVYLNR